MRKGHGRHSKDRRDKDNDKYMDNDKYNDSTDPI